MAQTQLTVSGMTCDHCVRHVTDAISNVAGVRSVNVKLTVGLAIIESDLSLDIQVVKDAVVAAGYSA
jgi:copper chaperone CopZ